MADTIEAIPHNPEELEAPLYEPISLDLTSSDIDSTMELYLDFLQLPASEREKIQHFDESRPRTSRTGYKHKEGPAPDGTTNDSKHLFHMHPDIQRTFMDPTEAAQLPSESRKFLTAANEIYHSLAKSAKAKYQDLSDEIPALVGIHFPKDGTLTNHLRFLAYQAGTDGVLARGHYDKGTGTIAVAESHGGLRIGNNNDDLELIDRDHYDPVFFHGVGWHDLAEQLDVETNRQPAWHDVIDTGEQVSEGVTRWAMVYFIDPAKMYLDSTKEQTHTPLCLL